MTYNLTFKAPLNNRRTNRQKEYRALFVASCGFTIKYEAQIDKRTPFYLLQIVCNCAL